MESTSLHLELLFEGFADGIKCHKSNLSLSKSDTAVVNVARWD